MIQTRIHLLPTDMTPSDLPARLRTIHDVAVSSAQAGGQVLMSFFRSGLQIETKGRLSTDLVSKADLSAEQAVMAVIRKTFPEHAILGEESATETDPNGPAVWIIDPLDGTTNFLHDVPHFAVSVAFYEAGQPVCGVVWNPARDDLYTAVQGQGAWHHSHPIHVNQTGRLDLALIGTGFSVERDRKLTSTLRSIEDLFQERIHCIRRFGSAALDLCHVASGLYGGYFESQLSAWDFAAGSLIVREAGGQVTTALGTELPLRKSSILASNGRLHVALKEIVRPHFEWLK